MRRIWAIVAVMVSMVACEERPVGAVVADTPRDGWSAGEVVEMRYDNCDSLTLYDVGVVARRQVNDHNGAIPLTVAVTSPSGATYKSEVVLVPNGRSKGGSFVELSAGWIEDARLGEIGDYTFTLTPTTNLKGVWTAGVVVERIQN